MPCFETSAASVNYVERSSPTSAAKEHPSLPTLHNGALDIIQNALFAGHDEGAVAWGRIASLTQTARLNGVEPYAWLKATLEAIAAGHPNDRIDDLLPWSFASSSS